MKVIGIIAEYNPFHNGHAYQIRLMKQKFQADYVVVVMSGDFVQRGAPAIVDKYTRAEMALLGGADAVIELPCLWSVASAEYFANGSITALEKMKIVDGVCFGCETPDLDELMEIADILIAEPTEYQKRLRQYQQIGYTYPAARLEAIKEIVLPEKKRVVTELLSTPNNILALEYMKAIKRKKSHLEPFPIKRIGQAYHDCNHDIEKALEVYPSASAIRRMIFEGDWDKINENIPELSATVFMEKIRKNLFLQENDFSAVIAYSLLRESEYEKIADITPNFANRIRKALPKYENYSDFCKKLKTKEMTYTRVSRALFHVLLGHSAEEYQKAHFLEDIPYLRLLGIKKTSISLISYLRKEAEIPILCRQKEVAEIFQTRAAPMLQLDVFATNLYRNMLIQKSKCDVLEENHRALLMV